MAKFNLPRFSAPKGVIAARCLYRVLPVVEELAFQCPEGRYSSTLRFLAPATRIKVGSFSAPKGVIAARCEDDPYRTIGAVKFQCPEGRYSSTLPRIAGVTF